MFDDTLDFITIDFRQHLELYWVGKGEQGVLLVTARQHKDYARQ